jgi:hypothetical protein
LCVPRGPWRLRLMQEHHDIPIAGHAGRERTLSRLARSYYWPGMGRAVQQFVRSCSTCQRSKASTRPNVGLAQPLDIPTEPCVDWSFDMVSALPLSTQGHTAVLNFVDRFSKRVIIIPTTLELTAEEAASLFIQHVFRHHGLCRSLVGDRDPRWTADFFESLFARLGTQLHLSTANHPQSDGQTEKMNAVVEQTLRSFVAHHQQDWEDLLPLVEFAINDKVASATGHTPFYLSHGRHPLSPSDLLNPTTASSTVATPSTVQRWLSRHHAAIQEATDCLQAAQARAARYADRNHKPVNWKPGQEVWVHRDFLTPSEERNQPGHKLAPRFYGPYKIVRRVSANAMELALPAGCRAHPVINISALKEHIPNTMPGRVQPPPPSFVDLEGHERFIVQEVLDERLRKVKTQAQPITEYRVHWKGLPKSKATWEPASFLQDESGVDILPLQAYKKTKMARMLTRSKAKSKS